MTKIARLNRSILYDYISSIELDLRAFVSINNLSIEKFESKIKERIVNNNQGLDYNEIFKNEKYNYLDFGDYFQLISSFFKESGFTNSTNKDFLDEIQELLPIRNRVMHSRPLLENDYDIVLNFVKNSKKYAAIIDFSNLRETKAQINRDDYFGSSKSISLNTSSRPFIEPSIENNLPLVDFDDTGFIGRDDKKKEIQKKLKSAHPIISVIGNGGIGKTSTVLSCVYDIIDDPDFGFEKVLWVSLKTRSLQNGEFKDLKYSMKSFDDCIQSNDILSKESVTSIEHLLYYMSVYKTLLILDNLETIDSNEVRPLFEDIPSGSKILITSRIGIGEYETRLTIGPFSQQESIAYFKRLSKCYDVKALLKATAQETVSFTKKLYNSPLCIKWFVINVAKGNDPNILVNNQEELVEFCLSNVYDKLSENSKKLLMIVFARRKQCSIGELIYLNDNDYVITIESINELIACNFIEQSSLGQYDIPEFASRYLSGIINTKANNYLEIQKRINKLSGILENMRFENNRNTSFKPNKLNPSSNNEYIATIYMLLFLESANNQNIEEMEKWFDLAQKSAPSFCDIYKVAAYAFGKLHSNEKADSCFKTAIQTATKEQLPYIYSYYSLFLTNNTENYDDALAFIEKALCEKPEDAYFLANYSRILKFTKRFSEASNVISKLLEKEIDFSLKRSLYSEYLDIQARIYDYTYDIDEKDMIFSKAYRYIKTIPIEYYFVPLYKAMTRMLNYLLNTGSKSKMIVLEKEFVNDYFPYLLFATEEKNCSELVERINDVLKFNIDLQSYEVYLPKREYGYIKRYYQEKGYGYVLIKGGNYIFFHVKKVLFPSDKLLVGQSVSSIPAFIGGRWQATSVELTEEDE